ncbi:uncharacterized protein LOC100905419 [Galendromus occidentalis]|uniref:Uncharacterized protein LOC100905419 n=1 Tax=Galendromus occidentalis TaxID=34638 RepID=A0AAJ6QQ26_9ACAR|nr:uncharacterized protein LOC100905419 [Galendromus occidentalis]
MWPLLLSTLLMSLLADPADGEPQLFGVLGSLHINSTDRTCASFRWTFKRPHSRISDAPAYMSVHLNLGGQSKVFAVPVSDPLRKIDFFESKEEYAVLFRARSDLTEGMEYIASFRNRTEAPHPIIRVEVKQKVPNQYLVSWDATDPRQIEKLMIDYCYPKCVSATVTQSDGIFEFTIPSSANFTLTVTAFRNVQEIPPSDRMARSAEGKIELKPPRKITSIIKAIHFEDWVYIEWDPPLSPYRPITHYHLHIVNVNETLPGVTYILTTPYLNITVPPLRGPAFEVRLRATCDAQNMEGERTERLGEVYEFRIPKYYPPPPVTVEVLRRRSDSIRFSVIPMNAQSSRRFKIVIFSPLFLKNRYVADVGEFTGLAPYQRVDFETSQCFLHPESTVETCGPTIRTQLRSNVARPSPVKVHPLTYTEHGRAMIRWDEPDTPNGPIAGYVVFIRTTPLNAIQSFFKMLGVGFEEGIEHEFKLGPQDHSFPYNPQHVVDPYSYAVSAFTIDTDRGEQLFSERSFIVPEPPSLWPYTVSGVLGTLLIMGPMYYCVRYRHKHDAPSDLADYQEEIEGDSDTRRERDATLANDDDPEILDGSNPRAITDERTTRSRSRKRYSYEVRAHSGLGVMWKSVVIIVSAATVVLAIKTGFPKLNEPRIVGIGHVDHQHIRIEWDFQPPANLSVRRIEFELIVQSKHLKTRKFYPKFASAPLLFDVHGLSPSRRYDLSIRATAPNWRSSGLVRETFKTMDRDWPSPVIIDVSSTNRENSVEYSVQWSLEPKLRELQLYEIRLCHLHCHLVMIKAQDNNATFNIDYDLTFTMVIAAIYSTPQLNAFRRESEVFSQSTNEGDPKEFSKVVEAVQIGHRVQLKLNPRFPKNGPLSYYEVFLSDQHNEEDMYNTSLPFFPEKFVPAAFASGTVYEMQPNSLSVDGNDFSYLGRLRDIDIHNYSSERLLLLLIIKRVEHAVRFRIVPMNLPFLNSFKSKKYFYIGPLMLDLFALEKYEYFQMKIRNCLTFREKSEDDCGNFKEFQMLSNVGDPSPVQNLRVEVTVSLRITWEPPAIPRGPINGYRVYVEEIQAEKKHKRQVELGADQREYQIKKYKHRVEYRIGVTAFNRHLEDAKIEFEGPATRTVIHEQKMEETLFHISAIVVFSVIFLFSSTLCFVGCTLHDRRTRV